MRAAPPCSLSFELEQAGSWIRPVNLCWCAISQTLMWSFVVIEGKVFTQTVDQSGYRSVLVDVNVLILYRAPEPLDKDIVQSPPPTIHTDLDFGCAQNRGKSMDRELTSLVRVEDFRLGYGQGLVQSNSAEVTIQGVPRLSHKKVRAEDKCPNRSKAL